MMLTGSPVTIALALSEIMESMKRILLLYLLNVKVRFTPLKLSESTHWTSCGKVWVVLQDSVVILMSMFDCLHTHPAGLSAAESHLPKLLSHVPIKEV